MFIQIKIIVHKIYQLPILIFCVCTIYRQILIAIIISVTI